MTEILAAAGFVVALFTLAGLAERVTRRWRGES